MKRECKARLASERKGPAELNFAAAFWISRMRWTRCANGKILPGSVCKPETKTKEIALKLTIAQRKKTFSIYITPPVRAYRGEHSSRRLLGNGKQEENAELRNFCPKTLEKINPRKENVISRKENPG